MSQESAYTDQGAAQPKAGYEDKAEIRRRTKGSDHPHQKDDMPASVHRFAAVLTIVKSHLPMVCIVCNKLKSALLTLR